MGTTHFESVKTKGGYTVVANADGTKTVQGETAALALDAAGDKAAAAVVFPAGLFTAPPVVVCGVDAQSAADGAVTARANAVTKDGFTPIGKVTAASATAGSTFKITWIAQGV